MHVYNALGSIRSKQNIPEETHACAQIFKILRNISNKYKFTHKKKNLDKTIGK